MLQAAHNHMSEEELLALKAKQLESMMSDLQEKRTRVALRAEELRLRKDSKAKVDEFEASLQVNI
jgi:hypothetical protein